MTGGTPATSRMRLVYHADRGNLKSKAFFVTRSNALFMVIRGLSTTRRSTAAISSADSRTPRGKTAVHR